MLREVLQYLEPYDPGFFPPGLAERYGVPVGRVVNLGSNESPYPPPKAVLEAVSQALRGANRYPNPSYPRLKEGLARYTGLPVECISVGGGANELLDTVSKVVLNPFDKVVIPVPSYSIYLFLAMLRDASLELVSGQGADFDLDLGRVLEAARGAKLVFLCTPNNPTGRVIPRKDLLEILDHTEALVAVDEAYCEFSRKSIAQEVKNYENLVVVRTMSKFFGLAGLRVGYALASPKLAGALERARLPFNVSAVGEAAALAALDHLGHYQRLRARILQERERVRRAAVGMGLHVVPSEANFLLMELPEGMDSELLAGEGVIVRDAGGVLGLTNNYIRATVGRKRENERLLSALRACLERR